MASRETDHLAGAAWRALADHSRDSVLLVQPDGLIAYANEAAALAYGYSPDELGRMNIENLRLPSTQPLVEAQVAGDKEEGVLYETSHVRRDGTPFPVEISSRGLEVDGVFYELWVVRDISGQHDARRESAELLAELESANRQLEGLLRIVSSALGRLDLNQLLHEVLEVLREVMDADAAMFFTLEGDSWRLKAQEGYPSEEVNGFSMATDQGFASRVAAAGKVLWIADVSATEMAIPAHEAYGIKAMLGVPLYLEGGLFGVVECAWASERLVSDAECVMLQVAADRIMSAVLGAQRYERTARSQRFEAVLSEASTLLNSSHQLDTPMVLSLQMAADVLECDVAAFGPFRSNVYEIQYAIGMEPRSIALGGHPAPEREVGAVVIGGADSQSAVGSAVLSELGLAHCAIVPVAVGGEWHGAVLFGRREPGARFGDAELDFARRFGSAVAVAWSSEAEYASEHHIAETLQEALLDLDTSDTGLEVGHLYRSATLSTRVGGDFYDVFEMVDGLVGVLVGDVSGKGLDAAVLTSFVKNTIRAFAHSEASPASVVRRANEVLATAARLPDFASVALMVVDPRTRRVSYCSAGHPPAIVSRADGSTERLECGSPVIGAFVGLEYTEDSFELLEGDVVVLYTDGVTEARSPEGDFFGEERLLEAIEGAATIEVGSVPDLVNEAVMAYTGGRLSDDIAVLTFGIA